MGYGGSRSDAADQLGGTGDGGVDGVIREDQLGLDRIYLQAKRYQPGNAVGSEAVHAFIGALVGKGAQKGVLLTTSTFSRQALAVANQSGFPSFGSYRWRPAHAAYDQVQCWYPGRKSDLN
jgi:restriction system protein